MTLLGDCNKDGEVALDDLTLVLQSIGTVDPTISDTDVNADGVTDTDDALIVLGEMDSEMAGTLLATSPDCFDGLDNPMDPCECLEATGGLDDTTPEDCEGDDGGGGTPGDGPGGDGPGDGPNCDELPRETEEDCEAYAKCRADAEFQPQIDALAEQINSLVENRDSIVASELRPLAEGGFDIWQSTQLRSQQSNEAAADAQSSAREKVSARTAERLAASNNQSNLGDGLVIIGGVILTFTPASPAGVVITTGVGVGLVEIDRAGDNADIRSDAEWANAQIDAAAAGQVFGVPQGSPVGCMNAAMTDVQTNGAEQRAAVVEGNAARAAWRAELASEKARINQRIDDELQELTQMLLNLSGEKSAFEEMVREECVMNLPLPQP